MASMAEVFNRFADDYQRNRILSFEQQKLIRDICNCRTHALGGHVTACSPAATLRYITIPAATVIAHSARESTRKSGFLSEPTTC